MAEAHGGSAPRPLIELPDHAVARQASYKLVEEVLFLDRIRGCRQARSCARAQGGVRQLMDARPSPEQRQLEDAADRLALKLGPSSVGDLEDEDRRQRLDAALAQAG